VYLKKLEIIGFKSFADKVAIDYDSGITAIVGPNGCGKTNIVDAVRWVIGEQKPSVLRSTMMENVIFNGTKNRKALSYAQVSLTIENTKGILPSEYSEITISRRCFRDGQSNYLLNGVMCRLKDITALFMDTGMGADAYSVIELKMVNDILSHRTQDRRKLFEEAAGITKYKERRREALYKLELAKENLTEANIEIRNRQRTVNAYERIAQKQQEAKEISDKLKVIEIDYHQRCLSKLIDETSQVESALETKETERETLQRELRENESIIDRYKDDLNKTERKLNESREKLNSINARINEIQTTISISEQRVRFLQENIERNSREKVEIESLIDKFENSKKDNLEKISVLKETIQLLEQSRHDKKSSLDETEAKVKISKEELKDLTSKHNAVSKTVTEKRNEYEIIKNKLEDQIARARRITDENITNINKVSELDKEIEILETEIAENKNRFEKLNSHYRELTSQKEKLQEEISQLELEILNKTHQAEKISEKIKLQIDLLENFADYSEGVKYLVKDRQEKAVNVVIDKLEVEDKFRVAIETALGEISTYLIVNDEESAQKFINILSENDKGKITFILKNSLNKYTLNIFQDEFPEILKHEGVYGWADRFIKCPDEYFILYKYLLDEYIIVENLEIARKLAKDNFIKFITLDGDIVTGSFLRAGSKTNKETLKIGREKLITDLRMQVEDMEKAIGKDKTALAELQKKLSEIQISEISSEIENLRKIIREGENKLSQVNYKKSQINLLAEGNNTESERLSKSNKELSEKMDSLIGEIEESENLKYQREKELEHFTTELENLADELTTKREEYNNFNIESTKVHGELVNLENEIVRTDESIALRQKTIKQRTEESEKNLLEIERLKSELGSGEEDGATEGLKRKLLLLENEKTEIVSDFDLVRKEYEVKKELVDRVELQQKQLRGKRDEAIEFIHTREMKLTKDRIEMREHVEKIQEEYGETIEYKDYEDKEMYDFPRSKAEIDRLRFRIKQLGGTGQMELGIYEQEKQELEKLIGEKEDLIKAEEDLVNLIEQINTTAQEKFKETFEKIRENFQAIFRELFMEGDEADLKLVNDPENPDPLDAKIDIIAKPRGKRPQLIDLLSGGEKTLTAIALLFAIYQVKPSPFCILDEVDAPLDDANIDRFIKIIRKFSVDTQFIIVTHNKRTMEAADMMYGVTMAEEGVSTIVNVRFRDMGLAAS
jgi:chromosome segregation protein